MSTSLDEIPTDDYSRGRYHEFSDLSLRLSDRKIHYETVYSCPFNKMNSSLVDCTLLI